MVAKMTLFKTTLLKEFLLFFLSTCLLFTFPQFALLGPSTFTSLTLGPVLQVLGSLSVDLPTIPSCLVWFG